MLESPASRTVAGKARLNHSAGSCSSDDGFFAAPFIRQLPESHHHNLGRWAPCRGLLAFADPASQRSATPHLRGPTNTDTDALNY